MSLQRMCQMLGEMNIKNSNGQQEKWVWDWKKGCARRAADMTSNELFENQQLAKQHK